MPFDFEKSSAMIYAAISGSPLMIAGVIGPIGKPEAVIAMLIVNFWYSKEYHLEELLNDVKPEFRKSSRAKSLLLNMPKNAQMKLMFHFLLVYYLTKEQKQK